MWMFSFSLNALTTLGNTSTGNSVRAIAIGKPSPLSAEWADLRDLHKSPSIPQTRALEDFQTHETLIVRASVDNPNLQDNRYHTGLADSTPAPTGTCCQFSVPSPSSCSLSFRVQRGCAVCVDHVDGPFFGLPSITPSSKSCTSPTNGLKIACQNHGSVTNSAMLIQQSDTVWQVEIFDATGKNKA